MVTPSIKPDTQQTAVVGWSGTILVRFQALKVTETFVEQFLIRNGSMNRKVRVFVGVWLVCVPIYIGNVNR